MQRSLWLAAATVVTGLAIAATAQAAPRVSVRGLAYRTDHQAEVYLERRLHRWGGIDLRKQRFKSAFCVNGFYSKRELRTGRHFPARTNLAGENIFHTFACTLSAADHSWGLYLVALRQAHWSVSADR